MSDGFAKLFSSITDSTIWDEDNETRIVWVTLLAMSDAEGYVAAAIPGIAHRARVSLDACVRALEKFQAPDPHSRSKENEGRRLAVAERGFTILNYVRFRESRKTENRKEQNRAAQAKHREQQRAKRQAAYLRKTNTAETLRLSPPSAVNADSQQSSAKVITVTHADAEAEAEAEKRERARADQLPASKPDNDQCFDARRMQVLFRKRYEATKSTAPNMGGKQLEDFHSRVVRSAQLQAKNPESLFLGALDAWLARQHSDVERRSPYACFAQAFGELSAPSSALVPLHKRILGIPEGL